MFIPDPATKKGKGHRQTRRIRNGMDESEASKTQKRCSQCGALAPVARGLGDRPLSPVGGATGLFFSRDLIANLNKKKFYT